MCSVIGLLVALVKISKTSEKRPVVVIGAQVWTVMGLFAPLADRSKALAVLPCVVIRAL